MAISEGETNKPPGNGAETGLHPLDKEDALLVLRADISSKDKGGASLHKDDHGG